MTGAKQALSLEVNANGLVSFSGELFNYRRRVLDVLQCALRSRVAFNFM